MGEDTRAIRVVLVDDQDSIHEAIAALLRMADDIHLVGQAYRGEEAIALCQRVKPDLVLMDLIMPGMRGDETTRLLLRQCPDLRILGLSSFRDYEHIKAMLESGAIGYLAKDVITEDLIDTIRVTIQGHTVFSPEIAKTILAAPPPDGAVDYGLTERERQVLNLIAKGHTNSQVADALAITTPTVRFHLTNLLHKFKVDTRSEALVLAAKAGLLD